MYIYSFSPGFFRINFLEAELLVQRERMFLILTHIVTLSSKKL